MAARKTVSAARVREWFASAKPEGVPTPGSRGRLHPETVKAFHAANPREKYVLGTKDESTVAVKVSKNTKAGKARSRTVQVPVAEARRLAGESAGKRGRLSAEALTAVGAALSDPTPQA